MKVVLFCGGLGTRLREHSETIPKPLVPIGHRPIIWHLMRYYAHFGFNEFILALGYRGDLIRRYFLDHDWCMSSDFTLSVDKGGRRDVQIDDACDWRITFVDTGMHSNLGQRLLKLRPHLENEDVFLANYSDGLSDLALDTYVERFRGSAAAASFLSVRPAQSFHAVKSDPDGWVTSLEPLSTTDVWINGGFFCLRPEIFEFVEDGEELVEQPFGRLMNRRRLWSPRHEGFWAAMDTFKDKIMFDRMEAKGNCPWMVWRRS